MDGEEPKGGKGTHSPTQKKGLNPIFKFQDAEIWTIMLNIDIVKLLFPMYFLMSYIYIYMLGWNDKHVSAGGNQPQHPEATLVVNVWGDLSTNYHRHLERENND